MKLLKFTVLGTITALLILAGTSCSDTAASPTDTPEPETVSPTAEIDDETAAELPELPSQNAPNIPIGDVGTIDGLNITINSARISVGNNVIRPDKGYIYYIVDLTLENTTDDSVNVSSLLQFELTDSEAYTYSIEITGETKDAPEGDIGVGRKIRGEAAFEIPENAEKLEFLYKPIFGSALYFAIPQIWEVQIAEYGLSQAAISDLKSVLADSDLEILSLDSNPNDGEYVLMSSAGLIDMLINDTGEVLLVAEYVSADSGNSSAEVFFISDEASLAFTEAGVFDPDTMTITIQ